MLPEAYQVVLLEAYQVLPEAYEALPEAFHPNKRLLRLDCLHLNNPVEHS